MQIILPFSLNPIADVNHPGEDNQTALHFASKFKKVLKKSPTTDTNLNASATRAEETGGEADDSQPNIVVSLLLIMWNFHAKSVCDLKIGLVIIVILKALVVRKDTNIIVYD